MIRLSPRLQAVAELVPPGAYVIDVGTDHAMIPVWLVQTGRAAHVWASDLREGPLQSAARLISETGTGARIELRQTDGLQGFTASDADTIIIAGMGGETIISILSGASWLAGVRLILEPQSKQAHLRRWLSESCFAVDSERLVRDAGRIYPILTARCGVSPDYSEAEYHTGLWTLIQDDPLLADYLALLIKRASAAAPYDTGAKALAEDLICMNGRLSHDDSKRYI